MSDLFSRPDVAKLSLSDRCRAMAEAVGDFEADPTRKNPRTWLNLTDVRKTLEDAATELDRLASPVVSA